MQMHRESVASQQASHDRQHRRFVDSIREVEQWQGADGSTFEVPLIYDKVYSDGEGGIIASTRPLIDTTGLTRLDRAN